MIKILFLNLIRTKGYKWAFGALLLAGFLSLYIGKNFITHHENTIKKTSTYQQETIDRYVKFENKEMGLLLYYLKFGIVNDVPKITALSIGQRDVSQNVASVTIRNLEEQKYSPTLQNPVYQLLGNLDFGFVVIYLFPLVIIAFCFNVLSEEQENGTWKLLCSQVSNPYQTIFYKFFIRFLIIQGALLGLLFIAKMYLNVLFDISFVVFVLVSVLYVVFWFAVNVFVVSLQKNSKKNALILLTTWIMLTIMIPATANAIIAQSYTAQESFETMLKNRDGYHKKWDLDKEPTIQKFQQHYPQFKSYTHPKDKDFSWFWYYAMQQMGDDEAKQHAQALKMKLEKREKNSKIIAWFFPTIHTQLTFNQLAKSDLTNQIDFWNAIEKFHEEKRLYFYPKIFENSPVLKEDWKKWNLVYFTKNTPIDWVGIFTPFVVLIFILLFISKNNYAYRQKFNQDI